ncbi:Rieske (2Fe-2S) protein [Sphingomonas profundi]|uniref:Rieske (2Fe-2S) protein n=1 Tax=Alterirhizorhabdus profundi TaxID=2681549 RepID=UPI0012E97E77|nr:Rieske 2Fe-2S domain-containing protein [Sphingomonas profundi]
MSETFHRAIALADLPAGKPAAVELNGWPVLVAILPEGPRAVINRCSHAASDLASGRIRRGAIVCPLHGAMFKLDTGQCIAAPYQPLKTFAVRTADDWIEVEVPDEAPPANMLPVKPLKT